MVWPGGAQNQEAEFFRPPDFVERKGSLYLRQISSKKSPVSSYPKYKC